MDTKHDDTQTTAMPSIDWKAIRESLSWDSTEREHDLLRQRAAQYAAPSKQIDNTTAETSLSVLTFALGIERYGIEVTAVRGVRTLGKITPVPGVPTFYRGVINVRGQILTLLDLQLFFGMNALPGNAPNTTPVSHKELIMVDTYGLHLGLLATHVEGVLRIQRRAIQPLDYMRYAQGITTERLIILNLETIFNDHQLMIGHEDHE